MYGVHIAFDDEREPLMRFHMNRRQYCDEMLKFQMDYDLKIDHVEEFNNGDRLIFYKAYRRLEKQLLKNIERVKSRERYYSRTAGGAGKGDWARSGAQG